MDEKRQYSYPLSLNDLKTKIENFCKKTDQRFTCIIKPKNSIKKEFMKWGFKEVGDYNLNILNLTCSDSDTNKLLENAKTNSAEDLFCIFDNVETECKKEKMYKLVD